MLTVRLARARIGPGSRVLDLGCGGGRHAFACAKAGADVVALDADSVVLEEVAALFEAMRGAGEIVGPARVATLAGDATSLPFPDASFDRIVAAEVLEHLLDDETVLGELARVLRPGGVVAISVPRAGPELVNWTLSRAYHSVEGGHIRIYRRSQLRARAERVGLVVYGAHHAHALHTPYWWLRCLVGIDREDHRLVALYHRLLVYAIVRRPPLLRLVERLLNPVFGKSLVVYCEKPAPPVTGPGAPGAPGGLVARVVVRATVEPRSGMPRGSGSRAQIVATAATIAALQEGDGMIPWFEGGPCDPWNHVEAAMALGAAGQVDAAGRALDWLARSQRPDGAWHGSYLSGRAVEEARLDTNGTAYVALGILHAFLSTGDRDQLADRWPMLQGAVGFVLGQQRPGGEIGWSEAPPGTAESLCLLAGCSSIYASLKAAGACAAALGRAWPELDRATDRLRLAIEQRPEAFAAKDEFAMDWYYPVLSGAIEGAAARRRLDDRWSTFVQAGRGVLCRSDRRWITSAETAECAMACFRAGRREDAVALLSWTARQRQPGGEYLTGLVYPEQSEFPPGERTSYSAAAFVLAADALDLDGTGEGDATRATLTPGAPAVFAEETAG